MINQNRLQRIRYRVGQHIYGGNCWATAAWLCGHDLRMTRVMSSRSNYRFDWPDSWRAEAAIQFLDDYCDVVDMPTRGSIAVWGYAEPGHWSNCHLPFGLEHFSVELGDGRIIHQGGMHGRIRLDTPHDVDSYGEILHYVNYRGAAA